MEHVLKLNSEDVEVRHDLTCYRRLVGKLIYLIITRPKITITVNTLSLFMHHPRKPHLDVVFCLLRYLKNAPGRGIFFLFLWVFKTQGIMMLIGLDANQRRG